MIRLRGVQSDLFYWVLLFLTFLWISGQYQWCWDGFLPPTTRGGVSLCTKSAVRVLIEYWSVVGLSKVMQSCTHLGFVFVCAFSCLYTYVAASGVCSKRGGWCIGSHDQGLANGTRCVQSQLTATLQDDLRSVQDRQGYFYLSTTVLYHHIHVYNRVFQYTLVCGHTRIYNRWWIDNKLSMNPCTEVVTLMIPNLSSSADSSCSTQSIPCGDLECSKIHA